MPDNVKLGEDRSGNNFDFLRLAAALLVILSHSFVLSGVFELEPLVLLTGSMSMGTLAVVVFFVISGYLITKSWVSRPSFIKFLWNRFLRIVPGLATVGLFTVFILGPMVTTLPLKQYFSSPMTWNYLKAATIYGIKFQLPGLFHANPYPDIVNGSIWTLPMEVNMYLVILGLGLLGLIRRRWFVLCVTAALAALHTFCIFASPAVSGKIFATLNGWLPFLGLNLLSLSYPVYFMLGALLYVFRERIKYKGLLFLLSLAVWFYFFHTKYFDLASFFCLPYAVLWLAFQPVRLLNRFGKSGDYSYGTYIYAFPVQQSLAHYIPGIPTPALFLLAVPITLVLAYLSWHFVEARALSYKKLDFCSQQLRRYRLLEFLISRLKRAYLELTKSGRGHDLN